MAKGKFFLGMLFGLVALLVSSQVFAQADVNEKRQALMKNTGEAAKAIKAAVEAKDFATVETKARDIMGNADKIVALFPKGSTTGKTKALPAIWEKSAIWDPFVAIQSMNRSTPKFRIWANQSGLNNSPAAMLASYWLW